MEELIKGSRSGLQTESGAGFQEQDRDSGEPSDLVRRAPLGHGGEQHRDMAKSFTQK